MKLRAPYAIGVAALVALVLSAFLAAPHAAAQPVSVDLDPFRLNLKLEDQSRQVLGAPPRSNESATFGLYFNGVWERVTSVSRVDGEPNVYSAITDRGTPLRISVENGERVSTVTIDGPPDIERIGYGFVAVERERFYTYAPQSRSLNARGARVDSRVDSSAVPFAMSSRGFGVSLPTGGDFQFDFAGSAELFTFWADGASVTFRIYTNPNLNNILRRYTEESGRMRLPPTAQYGVWKHHGRIASVDDLLADASILRAYDVGTSAYVLNQNWATHNAQITSTADSAPTAAVAVTELSEAGYNVMVNVWPVVSPGTSIYEEAEARQFLVRDSTGAPLLISHGSNPSIETAKELNAAAQDTDSFSDDTAVQVALVDFTHPDAASWWTNRVAQLARADVNGVVLNEVPLPDFAVYHEEAPGRAVWRKWRTAYVASSTQAFTDEGVKHPVVVGHVTDGTSARNLSLVQTAQWTADFDSVTGLPAAVIAAQQAGLSGTPLWTAAPTADAKTVQREPLARWVQFQALTPSMQIGGPTGMESWLADPDLAPILRRYTRLHSNLSTYLYRQFQEAKRSGRPVIRPMITEVRHGTRTEFPEDQYYVGGDMIVAPVVDTSSVRSAYLPPGEWMHFWTLEIFSGDREVQVPAPLDEIPVFVRHNRDALNNLYRPLYKREVSSLAAFLEKRSLAEPAPTLASRDTMQDGATMQDDTTTQEGPPAAASEADSSQSGDATFTPADVTEEVGSFDLASLPDATPEATAPAREFRVFLDKINVALAALKLKRRQGDIAPVAADSLHERLMDLDRTVRAILSIIEA
jgi:alpha-glucosidase (family GH31 glycosyl hydrolase)